GGHGVIAADLAVAAGLTLPRITPAVAADLASFLPPTAVTRNPLDLAGGGEQDLANFERVVRRLLASGEVDAALLTGYFGGYSQYSDEFLEREVAVAQAMARAAKETGRTLVAHTMYWRSPAASALRAGGVPVYREIEAAVASLVRLGARAEKRPRGIPALPAAAPRVEALPGYWAARDLVAAAGIELAAAERVRTAEEASRAAAELGYPVAVKALGRLHKSDAGGVVLGIGSEEELLAVLSDLEARLGADEYSVERMAPHGAGVELIVGVRRDVRFGPIVLVGLGGLYAELLGDVAVALAPIDPREGEELLRSLRGAPLLTGGRGRPAVDLAAAARAAAALSAFAAEHPEIGEIEVNPLLVLPRGAIALDARVVPAEEGGSRAG
ncbi:MAG: acetate--CoA ligase family protein, partial [Actinomycetota bacterium]|nr:acetate--CoA ligase family protein [Actinomycetota bacterium]